MLHVVRKERKTEFRKERKTEFWTCVVHSVDLCFEVLIVRKRLN
jgi:hypothetical protein